MGLYAYGHLFLLLFTLDACFELNLVPDGVVQVKAYQLGSFQHSHN